VSDRKRINISVDPVTYEKLQQIKRDHGFSNACELVVSFVNILIDRMEPATRRKYDLPDEDGGYIDQMFNDLGHIQRTPDGTVPVRRHTKKLK